MELQKLLSKARRAAEDYDMIEEGDKIAVGLSCGKDSITLLCILAAMRRFYPKKYELIAISIDMGLGLDEKEVQAVKDLCARLNVEYVLSAPICDAARSIRPPSPTGATKSRWGIIPTISRKRSCCRCFTRADYPHSRP